MSDFKLAAKAYADAETLFESILLKEVERLAKGVINTHPWAKSFCMAMGSASFGCKWQEVDESDPTDTWERDENLDPDDLSNGNSYASELDKLLCEYDNKFKLTGCPMRITCDYITGELITATDW